MPGPSSISREHRLRVLENQQRLAAERADAARGRDDPQLKMPLMVPVKPAGTEPRGRRARRQSRADQPDLGEL